MFDKLLQPDRPAVHVTALNQSLLDDARDDLARRFPAAVIRVLRGRKVRTEAALFDHVATAFSFPSYFGETWDALADCVSDLPSVPHLLIVSGASELLADAAPRALVVMMQIIERANGGSTRGPGSFQLLLQDQPAEAAQFADRLRALGVPYHDEIE
jgi:RNAse (barnase) inhibitor barstar